MSDWKRDALPVLEAAYAVSMRQLDDPYVPRVEVARELGRNDEDPATARAMHDLEEAGYFEAEIPAGMGQFGPVIVTLTEKAFQVVAGWPGVGGESLFSRMLAEIDERVASARTEEERTGLERLRDGLISVGRDVFTNVVSAAAEGATRGIT